MIWSVFSPPFCLISYFMLFYSFLFNNFQVEQFKDQTLSLFNKKKEKLTIYIEMTITVDYICAERKS